MARDLTTGQRAAVRAVKARRSELGFTQQQLAELANVALRTVGDFERMLTWPQGRVLGNLERSLGWHVGYLADLAADVDDRAPSITEAPAEELAAAELVRQLGDELRRLRRAGAPLSAWLRRELTAFLDQAGIAPVAADLSPPALRAVGTIDADIALEEARRSMTERSKILNKESILALHDDRLRVLRAERELAAQAGKQAGGAVAES